MMSADSTLREGCWEELPGLLPPEWEGAGVGVAREGGGVRTAWLGVVDGEPVGPGDGMEVLGVLVFWALGDAVWGCLVGLEEGEGAGVGTDVTGGFVGRKLGWTVTGFSVGDAVIPWVVGAAVGEQVLGGPVRSANPDTGEGSGEGRWVSSADGTEDGWEDGSLVGEPVGMRDGSEVGETDPIHREESIPRGSDTRSRSVNRTSRARVNPVGKYAAVRFRCSAISTLAILLPLWPGVTRHWMRHPGGKGLI